MASFIIHRIKFATIFRPKFAWRVWRGEGISISNSSFEIVKRVILSRFSLSLSPVCFNKPVSFFRSPFAPPGYIDASLIPRRFQSSSRRLCLPPKRIVSSRGRKCKHMLDLSRRKRKKRKKRGNLPCWRYWRKIRFGRIWRGREGFDSSIFIPEKAFVFSSSSSKFSANSSFPYYCHGNSIYISSKYK